MSVFWPFIRLLNRQFWWMAAGTSLATLAIISSIGLMSLSGWFISKTGFLATTTYVVASQFNYFYPAAGVRSFSVARIITRYGERLMTHEATFKLLTDIRLWFYQRLIPLAPAQLMEYRSGDLLNRLVNDINHLDNLYIRILSPSVVLLLALVSLFIFYSFFSFSIALVTVGLTLCAGFLLPFFIGFISRSVSADLTHEHARLKTTITEHVQSLAELKIFHALERHTQIIESQNNRLIATQNKMSRYSGLGGALMVALLGLTLWLSVWMAVGLVNAKALNGAFIALIALGIMAMYEAVMPLPVAWQYLGKTRASCRRLSELLHREPTVVFERKLKQLPQDASVSMDNICFGYKAEHAIFSHFSLTLAQGEKVALAGATGCGKSTLVNLLSRFYDVESGEIKIGGHNIRNFSESQLRQMMLVISQQAHIFNGSIRDNLAIVDEKVTDEAIWQALDIVELKRFVETLADGLDGWTGEHGQHLSGGQKRRLALARVLLSKAPIVILDEPTEGLDKQTEWQVFNRLMDRLESKTVLLISHNPVLFSRVDRVLTLSTDKEKR
ncbi:MAG: thiol reductant ABC exporter subunit CydC [Francisellaceae bacterium]